MWFDAHPRSLSALTVHTGLVHRRVHAIKYIASFICCWKRKSSKTKVSPRGENQMYIYICTGICTPPPPPRVCTCVSKKKQLLTWFHFICVWVITERRLSATLLKCIIERKTNNDTKSNLRLRISAPMRERERESSCFKKVEFNETS